jgi:hypothetical protein
MLKPSTETLPFIVTACDLYNSTCPPNPSSSSYPSPHPKHTAPCCFLDTADRPDLGLCTCFSPESSSPRHLRGLHPHLCSEVTLTLDLKLCCLSPTIIPHPLSWLYCALWHLPPSPVLCFLSTEHTAGAQHLLSLLNEPCSLAHTSNCALLPPW